VVERQKNWSLKKNVNICKALDVLKIYVKSETLTLPEKEYEVVLNEFLEAISQ